MTSGQIVILTAMGLVGGLMSWLCRVILKGIWDASAAVARDHKATDENTKALQELRKAVDRLDRRLSYIEGMQRGRGR